MTATRATKFVAWWSLVPVCAGALALVGWVLDQVYLKSVLPGLIAMNPLTAICFILAGGALWLRRAAGGSRWLRRWATGMATFVAAAGAVKLSSYVGGFELGIDQWLFSGSLDDNRMAPNTAICFLLSGAALATIDRVTSRGFWPAQALALLVATVSLMSLVGYSYGATSLYQMASYVPMALNTSAAFGVLAVGILLARSERGMMSVIFDRGPGGVMARRLVPAVVLIPYVLGWLRIVGQRMGMYDTEFGAALMVAVTVMLFVAAVAWIAAALNRSDTARRAAEEAIRRFNDELEQRVRDRTIELAAANADLLQKNQENETFVYSVSHDLRSPLVNLQGFSQELAVVSQGVRALLTAGRLPAHDEQRGLQLIDEDMQRCIRYIQTAVSRLGGIIDALLRLSRAGRVEFQPQAIDTEQLVARIVEAMSATIFDRGVEVEIGQLPACWGDPTAIEQVFANLIGNAVNYLDAARPGTVEIGSQIADKTGEDAAARVFFVRDNGLGIDSAYHGKVFQALKRLHPDVAQGEGIGLAIVKRIVERHGGDIWFESSAGAGATFFVKLPAADNSPPAAATTPSFPERSSTDDHRSVGNPVGRRR